MTDHDDAIIATELGKLRAEMATEFGRLRTDMATEFGLTRTVMADGFGQLRSEMIDRDAKLLKWVLVFGATETAALAALIVALR